MPELPEVETTRQGIAPHIEGRRISSVLVREARLRWPVDAELATQLANQQIKSVERRAKYLKLHTSNGYLLIHLGMSGSLRIVPAGTPAAKHDHVDIAFDNGVLLRYCDPRRFGSMHWHAGSGLHPLLSALGPEPLSDDFDANYLYQKSRGKKQAVKTFLMDGRIVVGVGNIYANEALYRAGINPRRAAAKISSKRYQRLVSVVKEVLTEAIQEGGTTLRDFVGGDGKPGYFKQQLAVYGRAGEPCNSCNTALKEIRLGQRSTVYCSRCQR